MLERFVTISIDDGHETDFKTAELLDKYGLQATFYIPARNPERPVIKGNQIRELATKFEIGAHTMNHVPLKSLPDPQAWAEIAESKRWLEDTTGKAAFSFCYPRGKFNGSTPGLVEQAGFHGGRTCLYNLNGFPRNPFLWGVSTHAYSHSRAIQVRHATLECNFAGMLNFVRTHKAASDWQHHFSYGLEHVAQRGGIAHLYMHSWEIDELGQWDRVEQTFAEIARQDDFKKVTNGFLFELWRTRNSHGRN
jgi:peptidoglycan-N-acetylglucosamine deacetylase